MGLTGSSGPRLGLAISLCGLCTIFSGAPGASALAQPASPTASAASVRLGSAPALADSPPVVSGVRLRRSGGRDRLSFRISRPALARAYVLGRPDRVVVDLPEINFQLDPAIGRSPRQGGEKGGRALGGLVESFRFGLFAPGKSRIVVDLARPAQIVRVGMERTAKGSPRLVLELARASQGAFAAAAAAAIVPELAQTPPAATPAGTRPLVMIDPGHGGVDTGALGPRGIEEKNITLAFAEELAAKLKAAGEVRVALTRTTDVFVPLSERVRLAQQAGASLLLSIHADRISDAPHVAGATIYTVSNRASDAEAAREARRENMADAAGGLERRPNQGGEVADILFDLARRETRAYSNVFARGVVSDWGRLAPLNKNPHRSAGFMVLKSPDVPSALLELGYLSNGRDVRHLTSPAWRSKAAGAVADAIDAFFKVDRPAPPAAPGSLAAISPVR